MRLTSWVVCISPTSLSLKICAGKSIYKTNDEQFV
jgi:hypothetical protein